MHLSLLELRDFRNWDRLALPLAPGLTVFHGPNGAGKTNLLEAICLAASGDSPRARETHEMVRWRQDFAFVRAEWRGGEGLLRLEVGLARAGQRQVKVHGAPRPRADRIGLAPVVYFSADDITVIKGEPASRRRLLDRALSALSPHYYFQLLRYRRALDQRNRLLKLLRSGRAHPTALDPWDRALARYGAPLVLARADLLAALTPPSAAAHSRLTGAPSRFLVQYRPSVDPPTGQTIVPDEEDPPLAAANLSGRFDSVLRAEREGDIARGATGAGPHRDDFEVLLDGEPVRIFASQGEQRTCALALRIGLADVVRLRRGASPVLLLDDVLSELDGRRRAGVLSACAEAEQVIITCCDIADIPPALQQAAAVFEVSDGKLV